MPRMNGKAKKIAYKVLGFPQNMDEKQSKKKKHVDRVLEFEETVREK